MIKMALSWTCCEACGEPLIVGRDKITKDNKNKDVVVCCKCRGEE